MAAQEFSSPGEHMASRSTGNSGVSFDYVDAGSSNGTGPGEWRQNIVVSPSVGSGGSAKSYTKDIYKANKYNLSNYDYANANNFNLYNSALSWYERMQNSSIQRMVEDMKKAGINPVLAGRYNGYNVQMPSVPYNNSVPYVDVSGLANIYNTETSKQFDLLINQANLSMRDRELVYKCYNDILLAQLNANNAKSLARYKGDIEEDLAYINNQKSIPGAVTSYLHGMAQNAGVEDLEPLAKYGLKYDENHKPIYE